MTTLRKPTDDEMDLLTIWRAMALEHMPYLASLLLDLRVVARPGLGTFAVDAYHRLYVDFEAVAQKGFRWCAESVIHESGHVWGNHSELADEAGVPAEARYDWNIAGDMSINDDFVQAGCATLADVLPKHIGADEWQTIEHYYDIIRKKRAAQQKKQGQGQPGQGGQGQGQGQQDGDSGGMPSFNGCGSGSGGPAAPGELGPDDDLGGYAPAATEVEKQRVQIAVATDIRNYAAKHPGKVPGGMVEYAEFMLAPPQIPWQQTLASYVRRAVKWRAGGTTRTYKRRDRRRHKIEVAPGARVVYPGKLRPKPKLVVIRDTSGSVSNDELAAVTNEVDGIAKQLGIRGEDLIILDTDAQVHATVKYDGARSLSEITGRGGTNMGVGIAAAVAMKPEPTAIVVMTDGATPWPTEKPKVPVVACIIGTQAAQYAEHTPEWMPTVVVDDVTAGRRLVDADADADAAA